MSENIEITAAETDAATAQSDSSLPDDKDPLSLKVTLADLCARAAAQYAHRAYEVATDTYAQAAELQAEINGEMNPENAEVLFLYGRALFKLGQGKSTVLGGGGVTGPGAGTGAKGKAQADKVKDVLAGRVSAESASKGKGLVQLEDEDEEDEGDEGAQDEDEDQEADGQEAESDDLEAAFEALDLASVLFKRKLEALTADNRKDDNGKSAGKPSEEQEPEQSADQDKDQEKNGIEQMTRHIKERLGDTHDLLAEIHLENERFPYAVDDCRQSLAHKLSVYTPEDPAIAEAHYKLSLALEFASLTPSSDEKSATASGDAPSKGYDEKLRAEAAEALEAAIASTRLKLQAKEGELAANANAAVDESNVTRAQIADVEEMIAEMEDRVRAATATSMLIQPTFCFKLTSPILPTYLPTYYTQQTARRSAQAAPGLDQRDLQRGRRRLRQGPWRQVHG